MKKNKSFLLIVIAFNFVLGANALHAQADPCNAGIAGKSNAELQADLDACNREIDRLTEVLNNTKQTTANYANEVAKLTAAINKAQANIKDKTLAISRLNSNITAKQSEINTLENRIKNDTEHLADLMRKTKRVDAYSIVEAVLSDKDLSEFFVDVDSYSSTRGALIALMNDLRGIKAETETHKAELARQRDAEAAARAQIEASKRVVERTQAEQKALLAQSQNQERAVATLVADKQARAAAIRTALFGLRDAEAIPFSLALEYAEQASAKTGVRAALILGILQQESNLGANVGTCVITDLSSGATRNVNTGRVFSNGIHPTRDLPLLQSLLPALGRDPLNTKVSCPISIGYGGAMGPAQFIPSTWNLMKSKIASATGKVTPDPWNPSDAIMAMAVFLKDIMGTTGDSFIDQRTAACRYYSGRTCYGPNGPNVGLSYGNSVMNRASIIQSNIDLLKEV